MSSPAKAYLQLVPSPYVPGGAALQLVDSSGRPLGHQIRTVLETEMDRETHSVSNLVTITFLVDGSYIEFRNAGDSAD